MARVYVGVGPEKGNVVTEEDAWAYAFERSTNGSDEDIAKFKKALVEWFYSENWVKEEREDN